MAVVDNIGTAILKQAKAQKRNALIIRWTLRFFTTVSIIGAIVGFMTLLITTGAGLFKEDPSYSFWIIVLAVYGAFFLMPFLLSMPFVLPLAVGNPNVNRIVVFRKFNNRNSGLALRKIIRQVISNYGHVFTLSDSNFKIKWYVKVPILLGQASFFHFKQRNIRNERTLAKLKDKLKNKGWLNINWLLSSGKVFSVRSADAYWQVTAHLLLKDCSLVVIDVSHLTEALEWEMEAARALGLERSVILIASGRSEETAQKLKARYDTPDEYEIPLFYYDDRGRFAHKEGFGVAIAQMLARTSIAARESYTRPVLKKALVTSGLVMGVALLLLFIISPYLLPLMVGKYSPFPSQVISAYMQANIAEKGGVQMIQIEKRIRTEWPLKGAAQSIGYAWHHEAAECAGVAETLKDLAQPSQKDGYLQLIEEGEPVMADTAFAIVKALRLIDDQELALQLVAIDRIDCKEKALELLSGKLLDPRFVDRLMNLLAIPSFKIAPTPSQHVPHEANFFPSLGPTPDSLGTLSRRYCLDLYELLRKYPGTGGLEGIKKRDNKNTNRDVRILFSLLLLRSGDGSQLGTLFDPYFIDSWYNIKLKEKNMFYLFGGIPHPFQEIVDSAFLKKGGLLVIPSYAALLQSIGQVEGNCLPGIYIFFLLKNYPKEDVNIFAVAMQPMELSKGLYRYLRETEPRNQTKALQIIKAHKKDMDILLADKSSEIEDKLTLAWLLAHIGDEAVVQVAEEAAKVVKQGIFFTSHPYADQSGEILTIYRKIKERGME